MCLLFDTDMCNRSGDYFLTTGGLALAVEQDDFVAHLQAVFDRDWNSDYAYDLPSQPSTLFNDR